MRTSSKRCESRKKNRLQSYDELEDSPKISTISESLPKSSDDLSAFHDFPRKLPPFPKLVRRPRKNLPNISECATVISEGDNIHYFFSVANQYLFVLSASAIVVVHPGGQQFISAQNFCHIVHVLKIPEISACEVVSHNSLKHGIQITCAKFCPMQLRAPS